MLKVTAVSKALIGPCDQIITSESRHFGHYVKVRMIVTFLIGPSMVDVLQLTRAFYSEPLTTSGYATDKMNHSNYQGQYPSDCFSLVRVIHPHPVM